jgi:hypothetical protein
MIWYNGCRLQDWLTAAALIWAARGVGLIAERPLLAHAL